MGVEKITEAGLKMTVQRMAILNYLEKSNEHPSAEMVYGYIQQKYPTVTLSTVYNTLEKFVEKGIIAKVFTLQGKARYDARLEKHHHLFEKKTGKIIDIFDEDLNTTLSEYIKNNTSENIKIDDFEINFIGEIL